MYEETKRALKKAFEVCNLLYSLGSKYNDLLSATKKIKTPTPEEVKYLISDTIDLEKAIVIELKERYKKAAKEVGLEEKYGLAVIDYIALLEELKE